MANPKRESVRIYAKVPELNKENGTEKYFIVGLGSASGTISLGLGNEEKKDITKSQSSYAITKGAWTIQLTGDAETSDNVQNYITINSLRGNSDKLKLDILAVFQYIHKQGDVGTAFALKGKAIMPLTSLGGDGQANIQLDYTLSTSGDLTEGSIKLNANALANTYDAETDFYEEDDFLAGAVDTNLDPLNISAPPQENTDIEQGELEETI